MFLDKSFEVIIITNSSAAAILATVHTKIAARSVVLITLYKYGKQNRTNPVALFEYV